MTRKKNNKRTTNNKDTQAEPRFSYTLRGWEDGEQFERRMKVLDRWAIQSADALTLHFKPPSYLGDIDLTQDPHSDHLGGYLWHCSIIMCYYLEHLITTQHPLVQSH